MRDMTTTTTRADENPRANSKRKGATAATHAMLVRCHTRKLSTSHDENQKQAAKNIPQEE